jgi:hypothetical protein
MKIHGRIDNGIFSNQRELYRQFAKLEGQHVVVSVSKRKISRTNSQNSYLWAVVYPTIADYTGYTSDDLHYRVEPILALRTITDENGLRVVKKTSSMSTSEFSAYVDAVKLWAWHELNLYVPEPNEKERETAHG